MKTIHIDRISKFFTMSNDENTDDIQIKEVDYFPD